jgi:HEAT repeat protein
MSVWRWLLVVLIAVLAGCGGRSVATTPAPAKKAKKVEKTEPKQLDIKPVEVKADEFPSVEAALVELENVLQMPDGEERNRAEIRVQTWLAMQQDKAAGPVAAKAADGQQPIAMRITLCRILGKLGPAGLDTLIELAGKGDSLQLRRKAIETMGGMKPPDKKTIDQLIVLLDDPDTQIKWQTIDALIKIGQPAKAASKKLSDLRQNDKDESVRFSAGEALKKVDPRTTFVD